MQETRNNVEKQLESTRQNSDNPVVMKNLLEIC